MKSIAIFASGNGTNAENIIQHFEKTEGIRVTLVICNNPKAKVIERAQNHNIPVVLMDKNEMNNGTKLLAILKDQKITLIVLAGYLLKIPEYLIKSYPNRIVNIHPALLPKYGGKGMYGNHVHKAVIEAKEKITGITIHFVNEEYDEGAILFQATCDLTESDTETTVAEKIHVLEQQHFPIVLEGLLKEL